MIIQAELKCKQTGCEADTCAVDMTFAALTMIPVSCATWKKMLWSTTQARC